MEMICEKDLRNSASSSTSRSATQSTGLKKSPRSDSSPSPRRIITLPPSPAVNESFCSSPSSPSTSSPTSSAAHHSNKRDPLLSLSHSTSAPTVVTYINNDDDDDDDYTYVSDDDDDDTDDDERFSDPSSGDFVRSRRSRFRRNREAIRTFGGAHGGGGDRRQVNFAHSEELKKMLQQELSLSGGDLDQIQAFVVTEDVDLGPNNCRESARRLASRMWEARWRVVPHHALPKWLQDNDYLLKGHRPQLESAVACFKSIFRIHTETGNIWTHLLGAIAFISIAVYVLTRPSLEIQWQEKIVFSTFFFAAVICMSCSWMYHTMSCHSPSVSYVFAKLDYCGIAILTMGSFVPWLYYSFYCQFFTKMAYIVAIVVLGSAAIIVSLWEKFAIPRFRPLRAGLFIGLGLSGIIPAIHYSVNIGFFTAFTAGALGWLILMAVLYIGGALVYAMRVPERFFPGKCDIWFQSHQIFHVFVVAAAFVHYHGICLMAAHRLAKGDCLLPIAF